MNRTSLRSLVIVVAISTLFGLGCSTSQKQIPHMSIGAFEARANLDREDLVVLDTVEGTSSTTSILFGLLQIIDDSNIKFLYVSFFKDKYTYFSPGFLDRLSVSPTDRAYYKALEKAPDADIVLMKGMDNDSWGIPLLFSTESVTWRGKALKLKADM